MQYPFFFTGLEVMPVKVKVANISKKKLQELGIIPQVGIASKRLVHCPKLWNKLAVISIYLSKVTGSKKY